MSCFTTRRATRFSWLSISTLPGRRPETESLNFPKKLFLAKKRGNFDCVARSSVQLFANHSLPPRSLFFENHVDNHCSLHMCLSRCRAIGGYLGSTLVVRLGPVLSQQHVRVLLAQHF